MTQEQGRRPDQSQQNTPLRPALEAFGAGNTPFSTGEQPKTDFEALQTTTEPNVPVSGRNRMNSQLGIGTDDSGFNCSLKVRRSLEMFSNLLNIHIKAFSQF